MCDRKLSTENGILTCDLPGGHPGMHHAVHAGGLTPAIDLHKSAAPTPFMTKDGEYLAAVMRESLEVEWPQEGMNDPVRFGADTQAAKDRAAAKAAIGPTTPPPGGAQ